MGHYEEVIHHAEVAVQLSPKDPGLAFWELARVYAALVADRPEEYLLSAMKMTEAAPDFVTGWRHFVVAYTSAGRHEEAKAALQKVLNRSPDDRLKTIAKSVPISDHKARERFLNGFSQARLPD